MRKLTKEDKMMILALLLVFVIVIVFLAFEFMENFYSSRKQAEEDMTIGFSSFLDSLNTKPKNTKASTLRRVLNNIFDLMNEKEYGTLYSKLDENFKEKFMPTEGAFSTYMDKFLKESYSPHFSEYQVLDKNLYIVNVNFLSSNISDEDILTKSNVILFSDTFAIRINSETDYSFSFSGYMGASFPNTTIGQKDDILITLKRVDVYKNSTTFDIEIANESDLPINITEESIFCLVGTRTVFFPYPYEIEPHSTFEFTFTINTGLSIKAALPDKISFSKIKVGNRIYMLSLPIKYPLGIKETSLIN